MIDPAELPPEERDALREGHRLLEAAYPLLVEAIGRREAHAWLTEFARTKKPPQRRKTVHDVAYNVALRRAYEQAPKGRKTDAVRAVMQHHHRRVAPETIATALRQARRMQRRGMTYAEKVEAMLKTPLA